MRAKVDSKLHVLWPVIERLESYIAERTDGLPVPIAITKQLLQQFRVLEIRIIRKRTSVRTGLIRLVDKVLLEPAQGGFVIKTRVPWGKGLDFRFLIAHELAHTYFYFWKDSKSVPVHLPHQAEEKLCDIGARALLMPRNVIERKIPEGSFLSISALGQLAHDLDVPIDWVATRVLCDLRITEGAFFVYEVVRDGGMRIRAKAKSSAIGLGVHLTRPMKINLNNLIKAMDAQSIELPRYFLGKIGKGQSFSIQLLKKNGGRSLFPEPEIVYALLRPD